MFYYLPTDLFDIAQSPTENERKRENDVDFVSSTVRDGIEICNVSYRFLFIRVSLIRRIIARELYSSKITDVRILKSIAINDMF